MTQLYDSLKNIVQPDMITAAARILNEKEEYVSRGISSIFAGFLKIMLERGNKLQVWNIFEEAGNLNILEKTESLFEEKPSKDQRRLGDEFLQEVLGDNAADFTASIAQYSGISKVGTNRLVAILAPVFTGYFGKELVENGRSIYMVMDEIRNQEESFVPHVPKGMDQLFTAEKKKLEKGEKEKRNGQLTWGILIILFVLFLFLWRSCNNPKGVEARLDTTTIINSEQAADASSYRM